MVFPGRFFAGRANSINKLRGPKSTHDAPGRPEKPRRGKGFFAGIGATIVIVIAAVVLIVVTTTGGSTAPAVPRCGSA